MATQKGPNPAYLDEGGEDSLEEVRSELSMSR